MSIFVDRREPNKDDGIRCTICHKSGVDVQLYDMKFGFCDGETVDGFAYIAVHWSCVKKAFESANARSIRLRSQSRI